MATAALLPATLLAPGAANAVQFSTEWFTGSFDSTISFGAQRRMESTNCRIVSNDNGGCVPTEGPPPLHDPFGTGPYPGYANPDFNYLQQDDGNLNFKKGDIVSAVLKGTHDLSLKNAEQKWSALGRFTWSTDFQGYKTDRTPLEDDAKDALRQDFTLLDLWIAKEFSIGDQPAKVKLGNQVISWGEDIFIIGGINSINAIDLRKFHIPGTQLKEVFIPAPMLSLSSGIGNGFSMEAYYQFYWNKMKFDPVGSYWSTVDFLGKGARKAFIPTSVVNFVIAGSPFLQSLGLTPDLPPGTVGDPDPSKPGRDLESLTAFPGVIEVERQEPKKSGQFGGALRYKGEGQETEWSVFYLRYHDKIPFVGFAGTYNSALPPTDAAAVTISHAIEQYGEDRNLFGVALNTRVGDVAVGAEISYRPRDSVAIDPTVPFTGPYSLTESMITNPDTRVEQKGYKGERKWQAHLTAFYLFPQPFFSFFGASEGYFLGEVAVTHYPKLDRSGAVPYLLADYTLPDRTSWGYVTEFALTYANAFNSGWNLTPVIDFFHDVGGTSPTALPFVEGRKALSASLNFDLQSQWRVNLNYSRFWGGGGNNFMQDRDILGASVSYSF